MKCTEIDKSYLLWFIEEINFRALTNTTLLNAISSLPTDLSYDAKASLLRFAYRAANKSSIKIEVINAILAQLYIEAALDAHESQERYKYASWAKRYGVIMEDFEAIVDSAFETFLNANDYETIISNICRCDASFSINRKLGKIAVKLEHQSFSKIFEPFHTMNTLQVLANGKSGKIKHSNSNSNSKWNIEGYSDAGPKLNNDDSIAIAGYSNDSFLAVVADGTGDSKNGSRASSVAINSFIQGVTMSPDLKLAANLASAAVRIDNRKEKLDGATTLVAVFFQQDKMNVILIGDAFYALADVGGGCASGMQTKDNRCVLGGEPLGKIITSSGNIVDNIIFSPTDLERKMNSCMGFSIGSDGVITEEPQVELTYLCQRISNNSIKPKDLIDSQIEKSLFNFQYKKAKPDNVSLIVGVTS